MYRSMKWPKGGHNSHNMASGAKKRAAQGDPSRNRDSYHHQNPGPIDPAYNTKTDRMRQASQPTRRRRGGVRVSGVLFG